MHHIISGCWCLSGEALCVSMVMTPISIDHPLDMFSESLRGSQAAAAGLPARHRSPMTASQPCG